MLETRFIRITEVLQQYSNLLENEVILQQAGASPDHAAFVRQFLDNQFPELWTGRRGPVQWPIRQWFTQRN